MLTSVTNIDDWGLGVGMGPASKLAAIGPNDLANGIVSRTYVGELWSINKQSREYIGIDVSFIEAFGVRRVLTAMEMHIGHS